MKQKREIYKIVENNFYEIRKNAQDSLELRRDLLYKRSSRAKEIEKELGNTAINVARAVLNGADSVSELRNLKVKNSQLQEELKNILKELDLPENHLEIEYKCKICKDEGFTNSNMCSCMKNMIKKEIYNEINKLSPLNLSTFDSFSLDYYSDEPICNSVQSPRERMSIIYRFCMEYAKKFSKNSQNILMRGSTGLGKTHLSLAIANEVIEKGLGVIYISAPNMVSQLEKEKFKGVEFFSGSEEYFVNCDLIIIDDLGTEFSTQFSNSMIYNIVNSRILMSKPTIISTNLTIKELEQNYTERMVSRIMGENIRLEFIGEDIRQKKRYKKSFN